MITTVTTSTVTTVTMIAAMGLTATITVAALVTLIAFLTTKEVSGAVHSSARVRIARFVNVGIVPLAIVFVCLLVVAILQVMR